MRTLRRSVALVLSLAVLLLNMGMYRTAAPGGEAERVHCMKQLAYLRPLMHNDLASRMQDLFPEGFAFSHALYGLAWCNMALRSADMIVREQAAEEALWSLRMLESADGLAPFDVSLSPVNGAFYAGWHNLLLAHIVEMKKAAADTGLLHAFDRSTAELVAAYERSPSPYLPSYSRQAWPADNVVAMASIALHQRSRGADHSALINDWSKRVRQRLDEHAAIPHAWDPERDTLYEAARGSSMSLMNCLLPLIDRELAAQQFRYYTDRFLDGRLGVPMVREYAKGSSGMGDVDSGPVILGVGFSATVVGPGACRMNNDLIAARTLDATIEAFGVPLGEERRYILGALPIADLFIVWTRSLTGEGVISEAPFYWTFHAWSALVLLVLWWPSLRALRRERAGR